MNALIQIVTGTVGTLGFGILFNIRGKRLIAAAIGGMLSWSLFLLLQLVIPSEPVNYFIVSLLTAFYCQMAAIKLKTPTTIFITTSLVPLVPGGSLYYTMAYAFDTDLEKFLGKAIYTLQLASALALGIIVAATVIKIHRRYKEHHAKKESVV